MAIYQEAVRGFGQVHRVVTGGILFGFLGAKTFFVPVAVILVSALLSIRLMGFERAVED